jgi:hypothetical protein
MLCPAVAFPPVGPVGLGAPPSSVLCAATTALLPVSGHCTCRSRPDTLLASVCSWSPIRARDRVEAPDPARAFGHPVPLSGSSTRRQVALPRSRVTPLHACPALRPRWCPVHSPFAHSGLLPSGQWKPSAFPSDNLERYPLVHDSTHFGAPSRGLHPRSLPLRTPMTGWARGVRS